MDPDAPYIAFLLGYTPDLIAEMYELPTETVRVFIEQSHLEEPECNPS